MHFDLFLICALIKYLGYLPDITRALSKNNNARVKKVYKQMVQ